MWCGPTGCTTEEERQVDSRQVLRIQLLGMDQVDLRLNGREVAWWTLRGFWENDRAVIGPAGQSTLTPLNVHCHGPDGHVSLMAAR